MVPERMLYLAPQTYFIEPVVVNKIMWPKDIVRELIRMLHEAPALWNMQCDEYRDRVKKAEEVRKIGTQLNLSDEEVKKKIKSLKTQFRREHNKKVLREKCGDASTDKEWFGYNLLAFLLENDVANDSAMERNGDSDDDACSNSSSEAGDVLSCSTENDKRYTENSLLPSNSNVNFQVPLAQNKILKRKSNNDQVDDPHKYMRTVEENVLLKDSHSVYGENVAHRMRDAERSKRAVAIARNQIDNILFKLEMGYFDEEPQQNRLSQSKPDSNSSICVSTQTSSTPVPAYVFDTDCIINQSESINPDLSQPSTSSGITVKIERLEHGDE